MTTLPAPLTPPDCDLRSLPYMPLEVERLRRSKAWLQARRKPALGFYTTNLWARSWHEVPAASLEDDDDVLADAAMCSPEEWPNVRDAALRGWVKCEDGRLYHPVVAEKALEAWKAKKEYGAKHATFVSLQSEKGRASAEKRRSLKVNGKRQPDLTGDEPETNRTATEAQPNSTLLNGKHKHNGNSKPSSSESYDPPRARLLALCEALGVSPATDARLISKFTNELIALQAEGFDFERHILPAAKQAKERGAKVSSLNYLRARATELRAAEQVPSEPYEPTDEEGLIKRIKVAAKLALEHNVPLQKAWPGKWGPIPERAVKHYEALKKQQTEQLRSDGHVDSTH